MLQFMSLEVIVSFIEHKYVTAQTISPNKTRDISHDWQQEFPVFKPLLKTCYFGKGHLLMPVLNFLLGSATNDYIFIID